MACGAMAAQSAVNRWVVGSNPTTPAIRYNKIMDELHHDIEKFWREKFADEIEDCVMSRIDDPEVRWFNEGIKYAAMYIRYRYFDDDPEY